MCKSTLAVMLGLAVGALVCGKSPAFGQATLAPPPQPSVEAAFVIPPDDELPGAGPIHREDWFVDLWRDRRRMFARQAARQHGAVVFLGDSITQGWGPNLASSFHGMKTANRGISGDTSRGVLTRIEDDVLSLDPSAVVLLIGTNDIELGATPTTIADNVQRVVAKIHEKDAKTPIVLCRIMPSSASKQRPRSTIEETNRLYQQAFANDPGVMILDTWTLFSDKQGDAIPAEFPDLLHLNEQGYAKWRRALLPVLATLELVETEADKFLSEPGFEPLFNGRDLTGWGYRPTSESLVKERAAWKDADPHMPPWPIVDETTSFDGRTASPDGRFRAVNGRLVVTIPPEGRRIQQLWTTQEFGDDFTLRLEFRATPNADSGVYIRGPQLQCRDYVLAGPYDKLKEYRPQDWNKLEVEVRGAAARCTCNGELLEASFAVPARGPIGLEGDRGQMEYRRLRVRNE